MAAGGGVMAAGGGVMAAGGGVTGVVAADTIAGGGVADGVASSIGSDACSVTRVTLDVPKIVD